MRASTKSMPYPSSKILNRSPKDIAEKPSAPIATSWGTGRKIAASTNVPTATYTNPTMRNTFASSNHSDPTVDPKHQSNRKHRPHHHSLFESQTKGDSKPENLHPPSLRQPPHHLPTEESTKTKKKGRTKRITTPTNKGKPKEKLTGPSTK